MPLWDFFDEMDKMRKRYDKLYKDFHVRPLMIKGVREPLTDIKEASDSIKIEMELPGVNKKIIFKFLPGHGAKRIPYFRGSGYNWQKEALLPDLATYDVVKREMVGGRLELTLRFKTAKASAVRKAALRSAKAYAH